MKSLLVKDLRTIRTMLKIIAFFVGVIAVEIFAGQKEMALTMICMAVLIFAYFGMSTMTYDDMDRGMEFILTLPTSKKIYAIEKYVISLMMLAPTSIIGFVAIVLLGDRKLDAAMKIGGIVIAAVLVISLNIPLALKFGTEKTKYLTIIIIAFSGSFIGVLSPETLAKLSNSYIVSRIMSLSDIQIGMVVCVLLAIILGVSCFISTIICEKKEY